MVRLFMQFLSMVDVKGAETKFVSLSLDTLMVSALTFLFTRKPGTDDNRAFSMTGPYREEGSAPRLSGGITTSLSVRQVCIIRKWPTRARPP